MIAPIEAVAHVTWELPFPLRLPPTASFVWEPSYGVALLDPRQRVGEFAWKRSSDVLPATAATDADPNQEYVFPNHNYLITANFGPGREVPTARLVGGPHGGFIEPRSYSYVNVFLCLDSPNKYSDPSTPERASAALNNVLDLYRFVTLDPMARSMRPNIDCYYTMTSLALLPEKMRGHHPTQILSSIGELAFGHDIGTNRLHTIGLNSYDDLLVDPNLPESTLRLLFELAKSPHQLELFHQLTFSAIRRLKRREEALAVLDAQSAFESLVAVLVREQLEREGIDDAGVESRLNSARDLQNLQRRLLKLDAVAKSLSGGPEMRQFLGSVTEQRWRRDLYALRNRIVHEGLRAVSFDDAKAAIVSGLQAIAAVQALHSSFERRLMWSVESLELRHVRQTAGRLSRLFEA